MANCRGKLGGRTVSVRLRLVLAGRVRKRDEFARQHCTGMSLLAFGDALVRAADAHKHLGVALLDVRGAIGVWQCAHPAAQPPRLTRAPTVDAEALG